MAYLKNGLGTLFYGFCIIFLSLYTKEFPINNDARSVRFKEKVLQVLPFSVQCPYSAIFSIHLKKIY